jgi:hypothetical protein
MLAIAQKVERLVEEVPLLASQFGDELGKK